MADSRDLGRRVRSFRYVAGLSQEEFAGRLGIAAGSVSKIENGRMPVGSGTLSEIGRVLGFDPVFVQDVERADIARPWLRAYADAPKRDLDRQLADIELASAFIRRLELRAVPDRLPVLVEDLDDPDEIEQLAIDVRVAAGVAEGEPMPNAIRAAERLGCWVFPMRKELGRHVGLSTFVDGRPVICVSRPDDGDRNDVPGDRQRFTLAHELGHLTMHSDIGPPETSEQARRLERQAHRFAGAFLIPSDSLRHEINDASGRVTLRVLTDIKERWGVSIKALVMRASQLGIVDHGHARSLYKQISARGWTQNEPARTGNERAVWLNKALIEATGRRHGAIDSAAQQTGLARQHIERWLDWGEQWALLPTQLSGGAQSVSISDRVVDMQGKALPMR